MFINNVNSGILESKQGVMLKYGSANMSLTNQITIDLSDPAQVYRSVNKSFHNVNDYLAETITLEPRTNALHIKL